MIEVLFVTAALMGGALASYTDLKSGIIPNRLSFSLIGLGLIGYLSYSLYLRNYGLFIMVLKNFALIFIIGYLFWFLGGWSAGDAKELMFLAALVPQYPGFLTLYFAPVLPPYPFALTMVFNTFLAIFPFIALYAVIISFAKVGLKKFTAPLLSYQSYGYRGVVIVAAYSFAMLTGTGILFLPAVLALSVLKDRRITMGSSIALIGAYILQGGGEPLSIVKYFFLASLLLASLGFFFNALKILRKEGLRSEVKITELEEGMIPAEDIYNEGGEVSRDDRDSLEKAWESIKTLNLKIEKKKSLINTGAAGVTIEDIKHLKKMVDDGKLEDKILITRAMPFAPAILLGFLLSLLFGDLVFRLGGIL